MYVERIVSSKMEGFYHYFFLMFSFFIQYLVATAWTKLFIVFGYG